MFWRSLLNLYCLCKFLLINVALRRVSWSFLLLANFTGTSVVRNCDFNLLVDFSIKFPFSIEAKPRDLSDFIVLCSVEAEQCSL